MGDVDTNHYRLEVYREVHSRLEERSSASSRTTSRCIGLHADMRNVLRVAASSTAHINGGVIPRRIVLLRSMELNKVHPSCDKLDRTRPRPMGSPWQCVQLYQFQRQKHVGEVKEGMVHTFVVGRPLLLSSKRGRHQKIEG